MSTKTIRKTLEELKERLEDALAGAPFSRDQTELDRRRLKDTNDALAEVEAIEKAAKALVRLSPKDGETGLALGLMDNIALEAP
jgi:hypothetical protein